MCVHVSSPSSFFPLLVGRLVVGARSLSMASPKWRSSLSVATRGKQSKRPSVESGQPVCCCPPAAGAEIRRLALVPRRTVPSLSSLSFSLSVSPFVSFQTAALPTAPRVSRPFTYRSPLHTDAPRCMNGNQKRGTFSTTTALPRTTPPFTRADA